MRNCLDCVSARRKWIITLKQISQFLLMSFLFTFLTGLNWVLLAILAVTLLLVRAEIYEDEVLSRVFPKNFQRNHKR
jgi:hypothetical protein